MEQITDLIQQKRDKNRYNLYLNNKYYCALDLETIVKHSIKVNDYVERNLIDKYLLETEKNSAFTKCLKLISTRFKTRTEIKRYLQEKGYTPEIIFYCLNKLEEYKYLNDAQYINSYINAHKSSGKLKLKQELLQKGISEKLIDEGLETMDTQTEIIKELAEKYVRNKEKTKATQVKLYRYLQGRGFLYSEICEAIGDEYGNWE